MTDILGTGTAFNFKGKVTGYYYEGLLFDKNIARTSRFGNGRHIIIDVKELSGTEITDSFSIETFSNEEIPIESLKGDKYFVIEGRPRFGRITTLDDLKGIQ